MTAPAVPASSVQKLSLLDRLLPVWIFAAMALGIGLGRAFPDMDTRLDTVKLDTVSLPIALGLLWMMYPVLAMEGTAFDVSMGSIAKSVLIFLGVPLVAGALTRVGLTRLKGESWYEQRFLPRLGPTALLGLLYTIVLMFAMQGGNNFELAIAVAVGVFGLASGEALAGVVGPLIEVPALMALVYLSLWLKRRLFPEPPRPPVHSLESSR